MEELVVLGQARDPQISAVLDRLETHAIRSHVLDYYEYVPFAIDFSNSGRFKLIIDGVEISSRVLIWDRSKFYVNTSYYFDDGAPDESQDETRRRHQLQEVEWKGAYQLLMTLPGIQFLSHPLLRNGMLKPVQQLIAHDLGLLTPPSLVSNSKPDIQMFFGANPNSVLKSLSGGRFERREDRSARSDMLMTMAVDADQISDAPSTAFERAPHFFQRNIPKAHEVRLFAYEGGAHAFKVDSQSKDITRVDWRHGATLLKWEACALPSQIYDATQKFLKYFKLFYGCFDFIVTPEGAWVFLECNRDGQWAWLDQIENHNLSNGLADAIASTWFASSRLKD